MEPKEVRQAVEESDYYQEWKKDHPDAYLVHFFFEEGQCQVGYFDPRNEKITTFFIEESSVQKSEESEVFKEPNKKIQELNTEKIKVAPQEALGVAKKLQSREYGGELVFKSFIILQHLEIGQVFNITLVTQSMKTINIKISAEDGALLQHHIDSL